MFIIFNYELFSRLKVQTFINFAKNEWETFSFLKDQITGYCVLFKIKKEA